MRTHNENTVFLNAIFEKDVHRISYYQTVLRHHTRLHQANEAHERTSLGPCLYRAPRLTGEQGWSLSADPGTLRHTRALQGRGIHSNTEALQVKPDDRALAWLPSLERLRKA